MKLSDLRFWKKKFTKPKTVQELLRKNRVEVGYAEDGKGTAVLEIPHGICERISTECDSLLIGCLCGQRVLHVEVKHPPQNDMNYR